MKLTQKKINTTNSLNSRKFSNFQLISYMYLLLIIFISLSSLFYCYLYIAKFEHMVDYQNNLVFLKIPFGHGSLLENLITKNLYEGEYLNTKFILQKLPVLPILIYFISKISHNFFFIIILKNLIMFSVIFFSLITYIRSRNLRLKYFYIYFFIYLIPYNMFVCLNYEFADCLVAILFPSLFLFLCSKSENKYLVSSIILFFLYLTKTSFLFVSILIPIYVIFFEKDNYYKYKKFLIIVGPLLAMIIWGLFSYINTGKFAYGSKILTVNSIGMSVALHKDFKNIFPDKSVDIIHNKIEVPENLTNEWEIYEYFNQKNSIYLQNKNNLIDYASSFPKKIKFLFFHIKRDAALPDETGKYDNSIRVSMIPNKIIINLGFIFCIFCIFNTYRKSKKIKFEDFLFLIIFISYCSPLILAWATSKHIIPIVIVSYFYILHKNTNNKKYF